MDQVFRCKNTHADSLATLATSMEESFPRVIMVENPVTHSHDSKAYIPVIVVHIDMC